MIDFAKFNLTEDDISFIKDLEEDIINQNEIILEYKGKSFVLEPHGKAVQVYAYGESLGDYESFEELLLSHRIEGKAMIELVSDLEYGD